MSDDWEYDEYTCPKCGVYPTRFMRCHEIGCDDGYVDMHEFDDPMFFDEGDCEMCLTCKGTGFLRWCGACGYELTTDDLQVDDDDREPIQPGDYRYFDGTWRGY